ncbi:sensor histidine kinase [Pseudonocardia oroxyli]|uniref:sensor histidine kinase n=1 Tax=Pseudonocardia oroxyli TaxID=366584 RepID=UPI00115F7FE5|nr:histidine kinase [Pseudonocardia oroxyli]
MRVVGLEVLAMGTSAAFVLLAAPGPTSWSLLAGLVGCALLPLRHLWAPLGVIVSLPGIAGGLGWPVQIVTLWALGRRTRPVATVPWFVLVVLAAVLPVQLRESLTWQSTVLSVVFAVLSAASPLGFGLFEAARARLTASLRELESAREAMVVAREAAARAEERARIGREVHDAVGHHATLIAVGAAALAASSEDPHVRETAERLRTQAKEALAEMRSALGLLGPAHSAGVGDLAELVDSARRNGLDVRWETVGDPRPLPQAPDHAVYRVVQEALTNAARHAPGSAVRVEVSWCPGVVRVEVRSGPARAPVRGLGAGGAGLAGLADRIRAVGGELDHGPADDGFVVRAVLPLAPETPGTPPRGQPPAVSGAAGTG